MCYDVVCVQMTAGSTTSSRPIEHRFRSPPETPRIRDVPILVLAHLHRPCVTHLRGTSVGLCECCGYGESIYGCHIMQQWVKLLDEV